MSKYGEVACLAAKQARAGIAPAQAWRLAAEKVFPDSKSSRDKNCPRCAFLGLAEEGMVVGVSRGEYTSSQDNKRYAIDGVRLLVAKPQLSDDPNEMWRRVMAGRKKQHNEQMVVVAALWNDNAIRSGA